MFIPPISSPVCMACVPASYVDLECKHLFESADVAAAGAQGCSCDSLVYVYLRREQDGVHCLSNLTKIKNNIGNVYSSHCVHIHHVYSTPCVHIHHVYSSTSLKNYSNKNYHIFRKPWTSAFRWYTLDTSEKCFNLRKTRLRLHSFGPLWTISTGNQWEISEFGRLSCFSDFFV